MARFKLKLKRLDFISAVDAPAQETATALLIKGRTDAAQITATARVVKTSDELGLVFGWALTTKANGADYFDLHGDNIVEDDLIRVAAEFMANGGATDQQHDFAADGRVVFAMPLTAEVAKSFGIQADTTGLMVAIKPSADVFAKFKSGEYTGFSIAGIGEREAVKAARVVKRQLATNEVDGHAHAVLIYEDGSLYVQHATAAGAEYSHSHGIITNADGSVSILADSGHTHEIIGTAVIAVPADAVVVIQASASPTTNADSAKAAHAKSTRSAAIDHGSSMQTKTIVLTEAQHAHYSKLATADAEAFIAKSSAERDAVLAEIAKSDEVVFKGELTGIEVRKSQGDFALKLAQSAEASEKRARDAAAATEVEKAKREATELRKRAERVLKGLAGSDAVHDEILKAIESCSADAQTAFNAITDGARKTMSDAGVAKGIGGEGDPVEKAAPSEYEELIAKTMADDNCDRPTAADKVLKTKRGQELYAAISKSTKTKK